MSKNGLGLGIGSGLIASLCCIGPAAVVLLGLGPLFGISGSCFHQYRLLFFALGFISLVLGSALWIKKKEGSCSLEETKKNKKFLAAAGIGMVLIYIFTIFVLVPYLHNFLPSQCAI
ncbi:MAG: hypothetical protein ACLFS3_01450 [Candidatus Aenigmatarchaeota archaeon]